MTDKERTATVWLSAAWIGLGSLLLVAGLALRHYSPLFGPEIVVPAISNLVFAAAYCAVGMAFLLAVPLIRRTAQLPALFQRRLLWGVIAGGLLFRLLLAGSTPVLEDDWNRYLWDGAVVANGTNPYAVSPDEAQGEPYHYTLQPLARASGVVIERVNHPHLKTIYPPVAEAFFALAYWAKPFSLQAWRAVLLTAEVVTLMLLLTLLKDAGRSPLWATLYWWNPVVLKEIINSAHMEGIVTPFVLAALLLSVRTRTMASVGVLGFAAGAKLWPIVLAPLITRRFWNAPRRLCLGIALLAVLMILWATPILQGGLDPSSGFNAFARYWRTNSAHFPIVEALVAVVLPLGLSPVITPAIVAKGLLALTAAALAFALAWRPIRDSRDLMRRAALTAAGLFLLSPVQFPWYAIWMLPLLCFLPSLGLLTAVALTPIYYASFYFMALDQHEIFRNGVVWLIWGPVWLILAVEAWGARASLRTIGRPSDA